ncbi:hypothetical protein BgiMline_015865 [Biomphalaria glabrata]|nr:hypothetical protein BgiMline_008676 [Biomphalaria glabrata]
MTVRSEQNPSCKPLNFEKQMLVEEEIDDEDDDGDDEDNHFIISLEDNGEEEGLLCDPEDIDYGNGKLTIDLSQTDAEKHSAQTPDQLVLEEATHILTLPLSNAAKEAHSRLLSDTTIPYQSTGSSSSIPCQSAVTDSRNNNYHWSDPEIKSSLNHEESCQENKISKRLDLNGVETVHLDSESGGIWSEAIFISTSKGAFVDNSSNCNGGENHDSGLPKAGTEFQSALSVEHIRQPISSENVQVSNLAYPKSSEAEILNFQNNRPASSSTVFLPVPKLSGPFPRPLQCSSQLQNTENSKCDSLSCQVNNCTCIMCYQGRGIKDPDVLVDHYYVHKNPKRKRPGSTLHYNKKLKSTSNNEFTNISSVFTNQNQGSNIKLNNNLILRSLINAPPVTSINSLVTNYPTLITRPGSPPPSSSNSSSSTPKTTSKTIHSSKVFLSPHELPLQKTLFYPTVVTSAVVSSTVSTIELNRMTTTSAPNVTSTIKSPVASTQSHSKPWTIYYINSNQVLLQNTQTASDCKQISKSDMAEGIHENFHHCVERNISCSQTSIAAQNTPSLSHINCSPLKTSPSIGLRQILSDTKSVAPVGVGHLGKTNSSMPTILTAPPKETIYTKSLLKNNVVSSKGTEYLAASNEAQPSVSKYMHTEISSLSNLQTPANSSESSQLLNAIIQRLVEPQSSSKPSLVKENPLITLPPDTSLNSPASQNVEEKRKLILNNNIIKTIINGSQHNEVAKGKQAINSIITQPPEEHIPKSYIQDWVNKAKTLTSANLTYGKYLDHIDYPEQPVDNNNCGDEHSEVKSLENHKKSYCESLLVPDNSAMTQLSNTVLIKEENNSSDFISSSKIPKGQLITPGQSSVISNSSTSTSISNKMSELKDYSNHSHYSNSSSVHEESNTAERCPEKLVIDLDSPSVLNFNDCFKSHHATQPTNKNKSSSASKRKHSSTVLSSSKGIKLKIKLSDRKCKGKDPIISEVSDTASKFSAVCDESSLKDIGLTLNKSEPASNVSITKADEEIVETAEEMFQRTQKQAMQEVLKAQMGVGHISRNLRPSKPSGSFIDKFPYIFASGPSKKRKDNDKPPTTETISINSDSATNFSMEKENSERIKKRHLSDESVLPKQPKLSKIDYPKLQEDTSFTNMKKIYCTNILAGHQVFVKFNIFENTSSGRCFLVPFFNLGGSRKQFDVEDVEYISKAVIEYEKSERTCARHLLFYSREGSKATFLRKETNFCSTNFSEKCYKKSSFILEGYKRTNAKKTEPVVEQWTPDNSVAIEIDRAEVDEDIEKHFAEMLTNQSNSMSELVDPEISNNKVNIKSDEENTNKFLSPERGLPMNAKLFKTPTSSCPNSEKKSIVDDLLIKVTAIASLSDSNFEVELPPASEPCTAQPIILKKPFVSEKINPVLNKSISPVIKEEPPDDGYETRLKFIAEGAERNSVNELCQVTIKQEVVNDYFNGSVCSNGMSSLTACKDTGKETDNSISQTMQEFTNVQKSTINDNNSNSNANNLSNDTSIVSSDVIVSQGKPAEEKCLEAEEQLRKPDKGEDQESVPPSSSSDIPSSSDDDDFDENFDNLTSSPALAGDDDSSLTAHIEPQNLNPLQKKITSLVQSLKQRLAQDTPKLPTWLVSEQSHVITAKIRHKKRKARRAEPVLSDNNILSSGEQQDKVVSPDQNSQKPNLPFISSPPELSLALSAPPTSTQQVEPSGTTHQQTSDEATSFTGNVPKPISSGDKDRLMLKHTQEDNLDIDSTEEEITKLTSGFQQSSSDQLLSQHSLNTAITLCVNSTETEQLSLNDCTQSVKSARSSPSDFDVEVGTEDFPLDVDDKPVGPSSALNSNSNKLIWKHFSKPYSIFLSKEIKLPESKPNKITELIHNHDIPVNKPPNIPKKHQNDRMQKKNNNVSEFQVVSDIPVKPSTPEVVGNESVTSYLSNKFSTSSSKMKCPRLLCGASNRTCAKPKIETVPTPTVPEPISTAELSKTPSLSEIFGIAIKKDFIYEKVKANAALNATQARQDDLASSQVARKRTTSQTYKKRMPAQVAKKRTSLQIPVVSEVKNKISLHALQVAKKRTTKGTKQFKSQSILNKTSQEEHMNFGSRENSDERKMESSKTTPLTESTGKAEKVTQEKSNYVPPCTRPCYVRLEQIDVNREMSTLILHPEHKKPKSVTIKQDTNTKSTTVQHMTNATRKAGRRWKKRSRAGQRSAPPKKDIVDYYTYMIESLQKKAQQLEEASQKVREQKEMEEKSKKEKELVEVDKTDHERLDRADRALECFDNDVNTEQDLELLDESHKDDQMNKMTEKLSDKTDVAQECENTSSVENVDLKSEASNAILCNIAVADKLSEDEMMSNKLLETPDQSTSLVLSPIDPTFGKKDVVLCSLDEDLIKLSAEKQRLASEEDLLLAPTIEFDDDDDMSSMMQVDVEKLLGLETDMSDNDFILDSVQEREISLPSTNSSLISNTDNSQFCDKTLPCTDDLPKDSSPKISHALPLWKNIPEPESKSNLEKNSKSALEQPHDLISSSCIKNLKFKLKRPAAELIKSIKLSQEVTKAFGETPSEGNSPTENKHDVDKLFSGKDQQESLASTAQPLSPQGSEKLNQDLTKQPPIPKLKVKLGKETLDAIEKAKAMFNLNKKEGKHFKAGPKLDSEKLNKEIAEDSRFYLRDSKGNHLVSTLLSPSSPESSHDRNRLLKSNSDQNLFKATEMPESCFSEHKEKSKKEGIFYNVKHFADTEPNDTHLPTDTDKDKAASSTSIQPAKCNVNIDLVKLKLRLNPILTKKRGESAELAAQNEKSVTNQLSPMTEEKNDTSTKTILATTSKPLPALNTAKLCNILKNVCQQTNAKKGLQRSPKRNRSPSKMAAKNIISYGIEGGRALRTRSQQLTESPKNVKVTTPVERMNVCSEPSKLTLEKEDIKERSFFDCLQNVQDVNQIVWEKKK